MPMSIVSTAVKNTSLVTSPCPDDMSPIEAAIMDGCNALHAARADGDDEAAEQIRGELFRLLDRYDATDGEDHPNPAWSRPNQRALVHSAAGELDAAIRYEVAALPYADTSRRKEISLGNLEDRCIRAERADEAVEWFLLAQEVAPDRVPILLTGVQALWLAGFAAEADGVCGVLLGMAGLMHAGSELTAYLDYEERLREIAGEVPNLAELFRRWDAMNGRES
jgi:hypothetical protein